MNWKLLIKFFEEDYVTNFDDAVTGGFGDTQVDFESKNIRQKSYKRGIGSKPSLDLKKVNARWFWISTVFSNKDIDNV